MLYFYGIAFMFENIVWATNICKKTTFALKSDLETAQR
jgi:hypothetical protein